jgi:hypothetical protein
MQLLSLRASLRPPDIQVNYRHETEIAGSDALLLSAIEARFVALTYKTLGLALTSGGIHHLPTLRDAERWQYTPCRSCVNGIRPCAGLAID